MDHVWYLICQWMGDHLHVSDTMAIRLLLLQRALFPDTARLKNSGCSGGDFPKIKYREVVKTPLSNANCVYNLVINFLIKREFSRSITISSNDGHESNELHVLQLGRMIDSAHPYPLDCIRSTIRADVYGTAAGAGGGGAAGGGGKHLPEERILWRAFWRAFTEPKIENWMGVDTIPGSDPHVTIYLFRLYMRDCITMATFDTLAYYDPNEVQALAWALRKYPGFTVHFIMQIIASLRGYSRFDVEDKMYDGYQKRSRIMKGVHSEILDGLSNQEKDKWNKLINL